MRNPPLRGLERVPSSLQRITVLVVLGSQAVIGRTSLGDPGDLVLASVTEGGVKGNGNSLEASLSLDGTKVAFASNATNLDPADTDVIADVYVKDLVTGELTLASVNGEGTKGNGASQWPSLSPDGTKVAFESAATNLDPADSDLISDVYVKDLATGELTLASVTRDGTKANVWSQWASLSLDGAKVAFDSAATNLDPADSDRTDDDVYVKDLVTGELTLASLTRGGTKGDDSISFPFLSADGAKVAFSSGASNLDPADSDVSIDVYVKDLVTGELTLASISGEGTKGNDSSQRPSLSADGAKVAFFSASTNLDPADSDDKRDVYVKHLPNAFPLLDLDSPATFTLTPDTPHRTFKLLVPTGEILVLTLTDPEPRDGNTLFLRWGESPDPSLFDHVADVPSQADQTLVVPSTQDQVVYLRVQANVLHDDANEVTLLATLAELALHSLSATRAGNNPPPQVQATALGGGFTTDTEFRLEGPQSIASAETQIIATGYRAQVLFDFTPFDAEEIVGLYDLVAERPGGASVHLDAAFEVVDTFRGPELEAQLVGVELNRHRRPSRLTLQYGNVGDRAMGAPLFVIVGPPGIELRLDREDFQGNTLQVLGVHEGVAGQLPPGGEGEISIFFRSDQMTECFVLDDDGDPIPDTACDFPSATCTSCEVRFRVYLVDAPNGTPLDWQGMDPPEGMGQEDWSRAVSVLPDRLGTAWGEYAESLARIATRLARRGAQAASVRELFRFAVREALDQPTSAIVGRVRLASDNSRLGGVHVLALQGDVVRSALTDEAGTFALDCLDGNTSYDLAVRDYRIAQAAPGTSIVVPEEGDVLGIELEVVPETSDYPPDLACDDLGRPEVPPPLPGSLLGERAAWNVLVASSWDPNKKDAPKGRVPDDEKIYYTIYFENESKKLAARDVEIHDLLDPSLDPSTFEVRSVRIGSGDAIDIDYRRCWRESGYECAQGTDRYSTRVHFDVVNSVSVDSIPASFRTEWVGREVIFIFETNSEDDLEGILAPAPAKGKEKNETRRECEGSVTFSVKPIPGVAAETVVWNGARIVFDGNEALTTNTVVNHISYFPSPPDGETDVPVDITLEWRAPRGEEYDLYFWESFAARPPQPAAERLSERRWSPPDLETRSSYSWQVVAHTEDGDEVTGPEWHFTTSAIGRSFRRGDADASEDTNIADAIRTLSALFLGDTPVPCDDAADVNDDGDVDVSDPVYLLIFLFLGGRPPPPPFPGCDPDPTEDAFGCREYFVCP